MKGTQKISFKDPRRILMWLNAALKHERLKYERAPVTPDLMPEYEMAQGWGYVVAAYSLLEQSLKAQLHMRGKQVPTKHSLTILFDLFKPGDKDVLREYYSDYRATADGMGAFPLKTLDEFINNLDGDPNKRGDDRIGSFDWRYSPIEEAKSQTMPTVSIEYLHEIIYGCNQMVHATHQGTFDPSMYTNSWRMHRQRNIVTYRYWYMVRLNSAGWGELGDRLEILWGPDYRGRYDWQIFKGEGAQRYFCELPEHPPVPVADKRKELREFDVEAGLQSIGVSVLRPKSTSSGAWNHQSTAATTRDRAETDTGRR